MNPIIPTIVGILVGIILFYILNRRYFRRLDHQLKHLQNVVNALAYTTRELQKNGSRRILEAIEDDIVCHDTDGRITWITDQAARKMFGVSASEIIGTNRQNVDQQQAVREFHRYRELVLSRGKAMDKPPIFDYRLPYTDENGNIVRHLLEVSIAVAYDEDGNKKGTVSSIRRIRD